MIIKQHIVKWMLWYYRLYRETQIHTYNIYYDHNLCWFTVSPHRIINEIHTNKDVYQSPYYKELYKLLKLHGGPVFLP